MLKYLRNSDIAIRLCLNPFNWFWIPVFSLSRPDEIYPRRFTSCFGFLMLQVFVDVDNGAVDLSKIDSMLFDHLRDIEVNDPDRDLT